MRCFYCNKPAEQDYVPEMYLTNGATRADVIRECWISYNSELDTFCCEECMSEMDLDGTIVIDWSAGEPLEEITLQSLFESQ